MTLDDFIASKPEHLRLGQYFVNCYCKAVNLHWEKDIDKLYNLDGDKAHSFILWLMLAWQWDELPDIE